MLQATLAGVWSVVHNRQLHEECSMMIDDVRAHSTAYSLYSLSADSSAHVVTEKRETSSANASFHMAVNGQTLPLPQPLPLALPTQWHYIIRLWQELLRTCPKEENLHLIYLSLSLTLWFPRISRPPSTVASQIFQLIAIKLPSAMSQIFSTLPPSTIFMASRKRILASP